ncbi:uncharacterized protein [Phaseolus vulgaris]|uniref:uncharacterized protein n=1 Tax=Phaseolus vulgaris TaxID=3885 RepID=UPI0035CB4DCE
MKIFVESIDKGIWDAIKNGHFVPMVENHKVISEKPWSQWVEHERKKAQYDCIAKNIVTSALSSDKFFRVSQCESAKEMWDTLEVTHEGTNDVKREKKHVLIQEYEMFRMQKGETIVEVQKRFTHIVNHLMNLGKMFEKEELNIKILKYLDRSWQPKVTAISESKDLNSMTTISLFGKLREHELEMNRLNVQENEDKHVRNIALKVAGHKNYQDSSDGSEGETLSLLTRKFSKFLKKISNKNQSSKRYNSKKLNDFNSNKYTCFGCGEQGHIKVDCPNNESKERATSKKSEKKGKAKKPYIAWEENEVFSSNSSSGGEEVNLCLMAKGESFMSCISSSTSINFETYSQLLDAFKETHEEANRLALLNNLLKGLNNWLKNRVNWKKS